jgi:benzylsuccinate CoA-transferase BbsF subunit
LTQDLVDRVEAEIGKFLMTRTKKKIYEEGALKRRIFTAPISDIKEVRDDSQLQFRNFWVQVDHPELNESLTYCGPFVKLSDTPLRYHRRAPLIGEHNVEVLGKIKKTSVEGTAILNSNNAFRGTSSPTDSGVHSNKRKVFEGIKVAEFAWVVVGPLSSRYFADHGATVVRIESHTNFEMLRGAGPFPNNQPGLDGSMFFGKFNANKYGASLDLNHPRGRELAWRFIKWADIVTESFRPGTMKKWGLDYESVCKVRPDIIYLSTSMQGQQGPSSQFAGTGSMLCALAGFGEISGWPDRMPSPPYGAYSDYFCQRFNSTALIAALEYRQKTGRGQWIEQSQLETASQLFAPLTMDYCINGRVAGRDGNRLPHAAPHGVFPCKGADRWVIIAIFDDQGWQSFCSVVSELPLLNDPKFSTLAGRKQNEDELETLITRWTSTRTAEVIETLLQEAGLCAHRVAKSSDLFEDPQLQHRNYFVRLNHQVIGRPAYSQQAHYILSKTPREITMPSPCLGEHNEHVYKELLGMTYDEISEHILDGSITTQLPEGFQFGANT